MSGLSRELAIVGVGYSELSRHGAVSPFGLSLTAAQGALDDAGLSGRDIDGIFEYRFGAESPGAQDMARLIGAPDLAAFGDLMPSNPSGLGAALAGAMAVASGVCETMLIFRCMTREGGYQGGVGGASDPVPGRQQFETPYGDSGGILMGMAMRKQRWLHEYGRTEEDFGRIAINARRWSALNPRAVLREPVTMEDYLSSRSIVAPLRLLDCDYPINGAVATVITTAERARDLRQRPVLIDAMTYATGSRVDWTFTDDFLYGGARRCADRLWASSTLTAADVDVAQLYDGFTGVTIVWVEAMGFCGIGEFGEWVGDGDRIGPGGSLPLNTGGGQLAEGRLHAISLLNEAVVQLRGEAGERQVPGAQVGLVACGLNPQCGAMVLKAG